MITRIDTDCILIANPVWDEAAQREWMRIVASVARSIDMLTFWDRTFGRLVREWHTLSSDFDLVSFVILEEFNRKVGPAVIPAYTMLGEIFSLLQGCGFFKYNAPYYQFAVPTVILPDTVRSAVYRLLRTRDADEVHHPEKIVNCARPGQLPPELGSLEKAPRSFIYRAPSVVISELEI